MSGSAQGDAWSAAEGGGMTVARTSVAGPIAVIPSGRVLSDLGGELSGFVADIDRLARAGMLPVRLEPHQDTWRIWVHGHRRVGAFYPTAGFDAYRLGHAAARTFRDEERLIGGALMLHVRHGFQVFADVGAFNLATRQAYPRRSGFGDELWTAWRAGVQTPEPAAPPHPHGRFLDLLGDVVEAARDIEVHRQSAVPLQHYANRGAAREQRHSARGVYRFRMLRPPVPLPKGTMVGLADEPTMRGQVLRVEGNDVTVRFEPGADFGRIAPQGALKVLPGDRVYRAQLDAIDTLRQRRASNMRILTALADARVQPFQPATGETPRTALDPGQLDAFRRAVSVPDLLCVLGPPGTGKTTTIVEIVRACAERGQRVLVTSHTNRAVDNVLERLPAELTTVRVGSEDRIGDKVRALSAEHQAESARKRILADTSRLDELAAVQRLRPVLQRQLDDLAGHLRTTTEAEAQRQEADRAVRAAVDAVTAPLRPAIGAAEQALAAHEAAVARLRRALAAALARLARAEARAGTPLAFLFGWIAAWQRRRAGRIRRELHPAEVAAQQSTAALDGLRRQADGLAGADPQVRRLAEARQQADRAVAAASHRVRDVAGQFAALVRPAVDPPPMPPAAVTGWADFHRGCAALLDRVEALLELQRQWRARIDDLGTELEHEIARYADVVGATAIGTDTSAIISDLEFDLVVVDEAGQISTPNLIVPLVRAGRAVLVGDHHQLPPFLDEELRQWGERQAAGDPADRAEIAELLARSAFERVYPRLPATNAVLLTCQRRMPAQIAEFVSATFYQNRLETVHPGGPRDPLFGSPLAMVNTADRPAGERRETAMRGRGEPIAHGYRNDLEAELIADLLACYRDQYHDWVVIVPFNAQRELLLQRLRRALPSVPDLEERVGSVDSFQGGERDLVVFGFTRSNPGGDVGFLKEVRRFNVAVSRARQQLVLVGDLDTLLAARPARFREVIRDLHAHLRRAGDLRASGAVQQTLRATLETLP
jgi:hypothetical protein